MPRRHLTRSYSVAVADEDWAVGLLSTAGTTGIEVRNGDAGRLTLVAYFDAAPEPIDGLPSGPGDGARIEWVAEEWIEERDWQAEFRRRSRPIEVGERFLVDPGEGGDEETVATGGRYLLKLPARTAFGTGSHETTQLTLEWLETLDLAGRAVLDVGSGSGILCLAARRLSARRSVGFDFDLPSALMSGQYERSNREPGDGRGEVALLASTSAALAPSAAFDVLLVNVLPHRIEGDLEALVATLHPGGDVIVSGVLETEENGVLEAWRRLGWVADGRKSKGEWVAWHLRCRRPEETG